jgi:hypothetical protein
MKRILIIHLMLIGFAATATPEKIYPKTSILKPVGWYSEQMSEWRSYLQGNASDADGWLNYYAAARFAQSSDHKLGGIVAEVKNAIPIHLSTTLFKAGSKDTLRPDLKI